MSTHSAELGNGPETSSLTPEQLAQRAAEQLEDRDTNSGGRISGMQLPSIVPRTTRRKRPTGSVRGYHDQSRPTLDDGSTPTAEEEALARERLAEIRQLHGIGVVADLPQPAQRVETHLPEIPEPGEPTTATRRELGAIARQLAMETGITHRVTTNAHGDLIVEPIKRI